MFSDLLQLTTYFSINSNILYTHTYAHTHTHTYICIGAFFSTKLQQMLVTLATIGIDAIFDLIFTVAP